MHRKSARQVVSSLEKIAEYVENNWKDFFATREAAYNFVLGLDTMSDRLENRTASPDDYMITPENDVTSMTDNQDDVLEYEADEDYMETFEAPSEWEEGDADEDYMEHFNDSNFDTVQDSYEEELRLEQRIAKLRADRKRRMASQYNESLGKKKIVARELKANRLPSVREIVRDLRDISEEDAAEVLTLIARPVSQANKADRILLQINRLIDGHGVEAIPNPNYSHKPIALYVNMGDAYAATVVWDMSTGKFEYTTWGDWFENWERENL